MLKAQYLALPKGVTITCPCCSLAIAETLQDIYRGTRLDSKLFLPLTEKVYDGAEMKCPKCSASYFMFEKIHTILGWLPK